MCRENRDSFTDDGSVHTEIGNHKHNGDSDGFFKALKEDATEEQDKSKRDANLPSNRIVFHEGVEQRVFPDVRSGIRCRQRNRDDKVCRHESKEYENKEACIPARQQAFQHADRAFTVRALLGDLCVNRECAEEGQEDEDKRCDGRERACGDKRNTWLIAKGREVVDSR